MNLIVVLSLIIIGLIAGILSGFTGGGMSLAVLAVPVTFVAAFRLFFQNGPDNYLSATFFPYNP